MRLRRMPGLVAIMAVSMMAAGSAVAADKPAQPPLPLIPMPAHVERAQGHVTLHQDAALVVRSRNARAARIARRFARLLGRTRGLHLDVRTSRGPIGRGSVIFELDHGDTTLPGGQGYRLDVDHGRIRVAARDPAGLYYGAATLWQLLTPDNGTPLPARVPDVRIVDHPRFQWRGVMLDSARHFQRVADIEKLLDWMSLHKLDVLHWHLTDDQGWRLQIPGYPKLTQVGGCRTPVGPDAALTGGPDIPYCGYYTDAQVRAVVRYAAQRFITVVPEIDVPGHAQAAIASYPWLGVTGKRPPVSGSWGVDTYLFNPDARGMAFLKHVLDHVMALFPSTYIHLGGDEAAKDQWKASPAVQAQIHRLGLKDADALQHWMTNQLARYVQKHGRRLIGWDEILGPGLAPNAAVMSWHGVSGGLAAAKQGHDAVLAPSPTLYLDHLQTAAHDEPAGRPQVEGLRAIYDFDPLPASMPAKARAHILGVQANLWTEYMPTFARDQHALFPRLAALAEVAWSPASAHDWKSFVQRLPAQLARYRALGIRYDRAVFAPQLTAAADGSGHARVTLHTPVVPGHVHYTTDGRAPTPHSPTYAGPFRIAIPSLVRAAGFDASGDVLGRMPATTVNSAWLHHRNSDQLDPCTHTIVLRLEDDRPLQSRRPVYKTDIANMCWQWKQAPMTGMRAIDVRVGNLPWNFMLWKDDSKVVTRPTRSPHGALDVHADGCSGPLLARMPLADAARRKTQTTLHAKLPVLQGRHDLCLKITGDPRHGLWAIDSVQLRP